MKLVTSILFLACLAHGQTAKPAPEQKTAEGTSTEHSAGKSYTASELKSIAQAHARKSNVHFDFETSLSRVFMDPGKTNVIALVTFVSKVDKRAYIAEVSHDGQVLTNYVSSNSMARGKSNRGAPAGSFVSREAQQPAKTGP